MDTQVGTLRDTHGKDLLSRSDDARYGIGLDGCRFPFGISKATSQEIALDSCATLLRHTVNALTQFECGLLWWEIRCV